MDRADRETHLRKTTSNKALSKAEIVWLIGGDNLLSGIQNPFVTEAAANKAFLSHVEELVALYTERDPGRRPELWWALSAPEERRVVGKAAMISGLPQKVRVFEIRESDSQYLQRLGLGLPHEKSIIREQASADSEQQ